MTGKPDYTVNRKRIANLNNRKLSSGPVIYWMSRDQRVNDNWSLLYAFELASELNVPVYVAFTLTGKYPGANLRHYDFMIRGLESVEKKLSSLDIPFRLLTGHPPVAISRLADELKAGAVVTDFDPLKTKREWQSSFANKTEIPLYEVDSHNVVPCKIASDKREFGAYTIRPKIKRMLNEFLADFPHIPALSDRNSSKSQGEKNMQIDWSMVRKSLFATIDTSVKEVDLTLPGENAAIRMLNNFTEVHLHNYNEKRNDPNSGVLSGLSPYLHFGQISSQRVALEIVKNFPDDPNTGAYLEELIVRKELSDNFCYYNANYDSFEGFPDWAKTTLNAHRRDQREYIYTTEQWENAKTHDPLWNAAQTEMAEKGKMHGYMRMYWAKKILEWSASPEEALSTAIYLNDKYELDGRDPNGFTGCAWSIGGVHDRAWAERPVFGKIRFMNSNGCRRKFDTEKYIKTNSRALGPDTTPTSSGR